MLAFKLFKLTCILFGLEMERKTLIAIVITLSVFLACSINDSMSNPFFPTEAENHKGATKVDVGVVASCFSISVAITSAFLFFVATPGRKIAYFLTGAATAAVCNIVFGVADILSSGHIFLALCMASKFFMGAGAAALWCIGIPWLFSLSPTHSGTLIALANVMAILGDAFGPVIGSGVFSLEGYIYPFIVSGVSQLVLVLTAAILLPRLNVAIQNDRLGSIMERSRSETNENHNYATEDNVSNVNLLIISDELASNTSPSSDVPPYRVFLVFSRNCGVWIIGLYLMTGSVLSSLINSTLAPYLLDKFDVGGINVGWYFLARSSLVLICFQFVGCLADRGYAAFVMTTSCCLTVLTTFLFYLPQVLPVMETKLYLIVVLSLTGLAVLGSTIPAYHLMQHIANRSGFVYGERSLVLVVGINVNLFLSVGRLLGAFLCGGFLYEQYGFYETYKITALPLLSLVLVGTFYLIVSGNFRRIPQTAGNNE